MINKNRLIQTFLNLVRIDSESGSEQRIAEEVANRLKELGASVEFDAFGNVIGKLDGSGDPFFLNAHLDTVVPGKNVKPIVEHNLIKSDGTTVLGADPKAGVAIILETLASLKEENIKHVPLEIVFTLQEEIGLYGAINLNYDKITAKKGVSFDGEGGPCDIDIAAPGYHRVDVAILGRSAHSGVEPEKGISAIQIAAEIIAQLPLGRIDEETTTNVGLISGGTARNAVPEKAQFMGEIRSRHLEKLDALTKQYEEIFTKTAKKHPGAKIQVSMKRDFNPYKFETNNGLIKHISNVFENMNLKVCLRPSGGGTDAHIFHMHGIEVVVLGTGMHDAHTTREYADIHELVLGAAFCEKLIQSLS